MGDFVHSKGVPKKYYRYFLKGLAYYTCYLNKACTLADLQAYVFLKSLQQLSEADLTSITHEVMGQLISTGIAYNQNGYYRLNELLRYAHGSSSKQIETIDHTRDTELSTGSGIRKMVNFSKTVTMWPTDTSSSVSNPSPFLTESVSAMDEESTASPTNKTDSDHDSDSDEDDEGNHGETAKTNPTASQANPDKDSDSNEITKDTDDEDDDDEDSGIPDKRFKQEPDQKPNNPESEDDKQKQE